MNVRTLGIDGAWELSPDIHTDRRGAFLEWLRQDVLHAHVGHRFQLAQANCSTSRAGVIRGIHFTDIPPGQAKYVTCVSGAVLDVIVDLRIGSNTYGQWRSVRLDDRNHRAVYIAEGLGHGFIALSDATVMYLCSSPYAPEREHGIHPLDTAIGIDWPTHGDDGEPLRPLLSDRDLAMPTMAEARAADLLPTMVAARGYYEGLAG